MKATASAGDGLRVDPGEPLERDAEQDDVEPAQRPSPPAGSNGSNAVAARGQDRAAVARPEPEPALAAARQAGRRRTRSRSSSRRGAADVEELVEPPEQRRDAVVAQAANDPVRRQDGQRLGGGLEEQHQQVVERRVLLAGPAHPALVAVAQRRLVAMVAVGDRDRRGGGDRDSSATARRPRPVGLDDPQPVADAVVVDDVDVGGARRASVARIGPARPSGSSYRPTTGLVLTPVARSSR